MKIRAIRLAEFGRFSAPVAIEQMSGGLDILSGPNELGKSTIFEALRLALHEKYSSQKLNVRQLRPYAGGAPMVEIEFEADTRRWHLRKRFLSQPLAELRDLTDGRLFRGGDADTEIARLVSGGRAAGSGGQFGLVWVAQRGTLDPLEPMKLDDGVPALQRALTREVAAVTSGARSKLVHAQVRQQLADLLSHAGTRPHGAYKAALKSLEAKTLERAAVDDARRQASERLESLGQLRLREALLAAPPAVAARAADVAKAAAAVDAARDALARRDVLTETLKAAEKDHARAGDVEAAFAATLADRDAALVAGAHLFDQRRRLEAHVAELADAVAQQREIVVSLRRVAQALAAELAGAQANERRQVAIQQRDALQQRTTAATDLEANGRIRAEAIAKLLATPAQLKVAERAAGEIAQCTARLTAAAPTITIAYQPGRAGQLRHGTAALADGETLQAIEPLVIEIEGIGRITIAPGGGAMADTRTEIAAHRSRLNTVLSEAGVTDIAELEIMVEQRRRLEAAQAEDLARLSAVAPQGLAALLAAAGAAEHAVQAAGSGSATRPSEAITAEGAVNAGRLAAAERAFDPAQISLAQSREQLVRIVTQCDENVRRCAELDAGLPPRDARPAHGATLKISAAETKSTLNRIVRDVSAWSEQAPDPAGLLAIQAASAAAEAAQRAAYSELARIREDAGRIEGALIESRNDDVEMRAAYLSEELVRATAEVQAFEEDIAVLRVLDTELTAEETRSRAQFMGPIVKRLTPYLDIVLSGAEIAFDAALAPISVIRDRRPEQLDRISDGTQEQIAVLVRLAYARLFADTGTPVPVILDDALVYADDQRIAAMFRALEQAAEHHQVIVLTCRTTAFEGLRGHRLALQQWSQADAA